MLPNPWSIIRRDSISATLRDREEDDEASLPVYEPPQAAPVGRTSSKFIHRRLPSPTTANPRLASESGSFLQMDTQETVVYAYSLHAGVSGPAPLLFSILVEPAEGQPNHYTFSISMKAGHVERAICSPVTLRLSVDPRQLDFSVFIFPPRISLPAGCLYNLRVWLITAGVNHRLFSDNDLWVGRDPDFRSVGDASFTVLRNATHDMFIYQGIVGQAHVSFIIKWKLVEVGLYSLSMEYEAGGAGSTLFEDCYLKLECEPQIITFMIYTIPIPSTPAGASHRLRVWLRTPFLTPSPASSAISHSGDSYICQRIWKSDDFKLGAGLDFGALGSNLIMGVRDPDSPRVERNQPRLYRPR